jgi:type I restriction enzyme S subunit
MNQDMKGIKPSKNIEPSFLAYQLVAKEHQLLRQCSKNGTTVASIDTLSLRSFPIWLAPVDEQRRIVAKIEELFSDLDAGVAALERVRANLKRYRAAVLNAAVTGKLTEVWRRQNPTSEPATKLLTRLLVERRKQWESQQLRQYAASGKTPPKDLGERYVSPVLPRIDGLPSLPAGWCWCSLDQLICYLRNGWSLKPQPTPPGHRLLRINAVRPMSVNLDEVRFVDRPREEVEGYFVEAGDLLFTRYNGSVELLGVCGRVRQVTQPTLHPDKLIRVRTVLAEPLNAYVELAANVGASRKHMASRARTTAGQTGISGPDVKEMPIPLCPLDEQAKIWAEAERALSMIEAAEAQVEHGLKRAARLRQSILKRAFEGKLVPQDPADAPVSDLFSQNNAAHGEQTIANGLKMPKNKKRGSRQAVMFTGAVYPASPDSEQE